MSQRYQTAIQYRQQALENVRQQLARGEVTQEYADAQVEAISTEIRNLEQSDKFAIFQQQQITYAVLLKACSKVQSKTNRDKIDYIIDAARINADDTLNENPDVADDQWDQMFVGSLGTMLCTGEYDRHVCGFFTKHGIRW